MRRTKVFVYEQGALLGTAELSSDGALFCSPYLYELLTPNCTYFIEDTASMQTFKICIVEKHYVGRGFKVTFDKIKQLAYPSFTQRFSLVFAVAYLFNIRSHKAALVTVYTLPAFAFFVLALIGVFLGFN